MTLPEGWRRGIGQNGPADFIDHDCGTLRISKATVLDAVRYTIWMKDSNTWIRPHIEGGHITNVAEACEKAEALIATRGKT